MASAPLPRRPAAIRAPGQARGVQTPMVKKVSTKPSDDPIEQAKMKMRADVAKTAPLPPMPKVPAIRPKGVKTGAPIKTQRPKTGMK
jgi:hypothetical protein